MNWKKIIHDLTARGYTQAAIAKKAKVSQSTIAALASGQQKDIRWSNGDLLMGFYNEAKNQCSAVNESRHIDTV